MEWWYAALFPLIFCYLYFNFFVIGMVHLWWRCYVLYLQLAWPCRRYFMQYDNHGLVVTTWITMIFCIVVLCEILVYVSICEGIWKYVFFLCVLGNHVNYEYELLCAVLGLMHCCSYLDIWVYNSYVDDDNVVCGMT